MNSTTLKSGPVPVTYTDEELKKLLDDYIVSTKYEFSYIGICNYIVEKAVEDDKVEGAPHTKYTRNELSAKDGYRISRILWEKIWAKEIYIVFGKNPYVAHYNEDTRFLKA